MSDTNEYNQWQQKFYEDVVSRRVLLNGIDPDEKELVVVRKFHEAILQSPLKVAWYTVHNRHKARAYVERFADDCEIKYDNVSYTLSYPNGGVVHWGNFPDIVDWVFVDAGNFIKPKKFKALEERWNEDSKGQFIVGINVSMPFHIELVDDYFDAIYGV